MNTAISNDQKWAMLAEKRSELRIKTIVEELERRNVAFLLIKGWAASRSYPASKPRIYYDIDIAVSSSNHSRVNAVVIDPNSALHGIDLHKELRDLDTLSWSEHLRRSIVVEADGFSVRIPKAEDHLRILAVHWLNDGGVNRERLWDIYYAVANRPDDFDWSECLDVVSETRRGWVICAIGLAHRYLGLDISDLPFREEAEKIPAWVIGTLEREWAGNEPVRPLQTCLHDPKMFFRQLRKRLPPNPIQATIQTESPIVDGSRFSVQIRNLVQRVSPSFSRVFTAASRSIRGIPKKP